MIERTVWQDEKDFTLEVSVNLQNDRVYGKGKKADVPDANLFSPTNIMIMSKDFNIALICYKSYFASHVN